MSAAKSLKQFAYVIVMGGKGCGGHCSVALKEEARTYA